MIRVFGPAWILLETWIAFTFLVFDVEYSVSIKSESAFSKNEVSEIVKIVVRIP